LIQVNQQRDDKLLKRIEMVKKENVIQDIDDTHLRIEDMREKIQKRDAIEAEKQRKLNAKKKKKKGSLSLNK